MERLSCKTLSPKPEPLNFNTALNFTVLCSMRSAFGLFACPCAKLTTLAHIILYIGPTVESQSETPKSLKFVDEPKNLNPTA